MNHILTKLSPREVYDENHPAVIGWTPKLLNTYPRIQIGVKIMEKIVLSDEKGFIKSGLESNALRSPGLRVFIDC